MVMALKFHEEKSPKLTVEEGLSGGKLGEMAEQGSATMDSAE
jgi:hypothetical protein